MATTFRYETTYSAPPERVYAMLRSSEFREAVCDRLQLVRYTVEVTPDGEATDIAMDYVMAATGVPAFAASLIGDQIAIRRCESWSSPTLADFVITIPGKPGQMKGAVKLVGSGDETKQTVDAQIKVSIPFVGGKIEKLVGDLITSALKVEAKVGREWLKRDA